MAATLHLVFKKGTATKTLNITDPAEDITKSEAEEVMQEIVDKKAYLANKVAVDGVKTAYYAETVVTELEEA